MNRIAFLFPGQGSQAVGMGKDFYDHSETAREMFRRADQALGYEISKLCFEGPEDELKLTENTQPALLVVSSIAFALLQKEPEMAAGHSLGEYSALVAAGALGFEDAVGLVHKRGRYMQEAVPVGVGAMAALLGSTYDEVAEGLKKVEKGVVEIANWNSKEQIVIAGHKQSVEEAVDIIDPPRSVFLPVSAPFHCELMRSAEEKLSEDLDQVEFNDLKFPIVANMNAEVISKGNEAREALKKQVRKTVLWYKTIELFLGKGINMFVEVGSGKVLSSLAKRIGKGWPSPPVIMNVEDTESMKRVGEAISGTV